MPLLRCADCGHLDVAPRSLCPACLGERLEPLAGSGRGRLVAFTAIRRPPKGVPIEGPYVVAVAQLDDGPRLTGRIAGALPADPIGRELAIVGASHGAALFGFETSTNGKGESTP